MASGYGLGMFALSEARYHSNCSVLSGKNCSGCSGL